MKRHRTSRLSLHRETLHRLELVRLRQAIGADTIVRGSAANCTADSKLAPCSEAPDKCNLTDPTKIEPC